MVRGAHHHIPRIRECAALILLHVKSHHLDALAVVVQLLPVEPHGRALPAVAGQRDLHGVIRARPPEQVRRPLHGYVDVRRAIAAHHGRVRLGMGRCVARGGRGAAKNPSARAGRRGEHDQRHCDACKAAKGGFHHGDLITLGGGDG